MHLYESVKRFRIIEKISAAAAERCLKNETEFSSYHLIQTQSRELKATVQRLPKWHEHATMPLVVKMAVAL